MEQWEHLYDITTLSQLFLSWFVMTLGGGCCDAMQKGGVLFLEIPPVDEWALKGYGVATNLTNFPLFIWILPVHKQPGQAVTFTTI